MLPLYWRNKILKVMFAKVISMNVIFRDSIEISAP